MSIKLIICPIIKDTLNRERSLFYKNKGKDHLPSQKLA